jgi:hypothetical protein
LPVVIWLFFACCYLASFCLFLSRYFSPDVIWLLLPVFFGYLATFILLVFGYFLTVVIWLLFAFCYLATFCLMLSGYFLPVIWQVFACYLATLAGCYLATYCLF